MNESKSGINNATSHFQQLCRYGGRLTGSVSERKAINYASEHLESLTNGLFAVHDVSFDAWSNSKTQLKINNKTHPVTPLPGCGSTPDGGVDLNIVDCGRGSPDDLKNLADKIKGSAVLVSHEYMFSPDHVHRSKKFEAAQALGAAAFIISNPWDDSGLVAGDASPEMPALGVSKQTAAMLKVAAQAGDNIHIEQSSHHYHGHTQTLNWVIPAINAKDSDLNEIIVCAHIDGHAISQSAMDNASGVAVALTLAAQLNSIQPDSVCLRILIFSAEEQGLLGSQEYVSSLSESEKRKIKAVINLDCVAGSARLCAMISEFDSLRAVVLQASKNSAIPVDIFEPLVANSDHYNFAMANIPAMRLIAGFGEHDSTLRHVLTSADKQALVKAQELDDCLKVVQSMIKYLDQAQTID